MVNNKTNVAPFSLVRAKQELSSNDYKCKIMFNDKVFELFLFTATIIFPNFNFQIKSQFADLGQESEEVCLSLRQLASVLSRN